MSDLTLHGVSVIREKGEVRAELRLFTPKGIPRVVELDKRQLARLADETTTALRVLIEDDK